jgi:hypothetical protein
MYSDVLCPEDSALVIFKVGFTFEVSHLHAKKLLPCWMKSLAYKTLGGVNLGPHSRDGTRGLAGPPMGRFRASAWISTLTRLSGERPCAPPILLIKGLYIGCCNNPYRNGW